MRHTGRPVLRLTDLDSAVVAVRCCPVLFDKRADTTEAEILSGSADLCEINCVTPVCRLDYRMVFAVATTEAVYLYDTQQWAPFAVLSNLHLASLSDVAWSAPQQ